MGTCVVIVSDLLDVCYPPTRESSLAGEWSFIGVANPSAETIWCFCSTPEVILINTCLFSWGSLEWGFCDTKVLTEAGRLLCANGVSTRAILAGGLLTI